TAQREPRGRAPQAMQKFAVAAVADGVAGFLAAECGEVAAAARRKVALVAADRAGRELEIWISGGRAAHARHTQEHDREADQPPHYRGAPSMIQRSMSAMSRFGSGASGGMRRISMPRRRYISLDCAGSPGTTKLPRPCGPTSRRQDSSLPVYSSPAAALNLEWHDAVAQLGSMMAGKMYDQRAGRLSISSPQPATIPHRSARTNPS